MAVEWLSCNWKAAAFFTDSTNGPWSNIAHLQLLLLCHYCTNEATLHYTWVIWWYKRWTPLKMWYCMWNNVFCLTDVFWCPMNSEESLKSLSPAQRCLDEMWTGLWPTQFRAPTSGRKRFKFSPAPCPQSYCCQLEHSSTEHKTELQILYTL